MGGQNIYLPLNVKAGKEKLDFLRCGDPLNCLQVGEENQEQGVVRGQPLKAESLHREVCI